MSKTRAATTMSHSPAAASSNGSRTLPLGWRMVRFDEIAQSIADRVDPGDADTEYYVGLEHLDTDSLKIRRWGKPEEVEATKLRFREGDIIFGKRRVYQRKLAVADFDGICSAHSMVIRAREEVVEKDFLPFFMQSDMFMERALAISVGSLSPTINWSTLAHQTFPFPPPAEQRRIATLLGSTESVLIAWHSAISSLDAALESVREATVADPRWESVELGIFLADIIPGTSVVGVNEPAGTAEYGVLKVSAVGADGFVPQENKRILDQSDFDPEFAVREGDVLITRSNTPELVGRVCVVPTAHPRLMLCDKTLRLVFTDRVASIPFIVEALRTRSARRQIMAMASGTGGAMKNISQERLRRVRVALPPPEEQVRIGSAILALQGSRLHATEHLARASALKQVLRETLLAGGENHV